MNQEFFTNLPSEITINILSRLPIRTTMSCKLVCKSWFDLIETHEFAISHLSKSAPGLAVFEEVTEWYKIYEFEDELDLEYHELHYNIVTTFNLPYQGLIQGSANGLLFLRDLGLIPGGLLVCNPITREYIELQCPRDFVYSYPQVVTFGFGASRITGEHKVVRIFHDCVRDQKTHVLQGIPKSECRVYTLGTGSWRSIAPGATLEYSCRTIGAFLKGNLHWLVHDLKGFPLISCFDLETECFSTLSLPPLPSHGRGLEGLFALGDCLCLCDNSSGSEIVIYLMKDYGVQRSWAKDFVISKIPNYTGESYEVVRPIKIFKDGDILMLWGELFLFYYSNLTKTIHEIKTSKIPKNADAILHTSSFISLKCFGMENVRLF